MSRKKLLLPLVVIYLIGGAFLCPVPAKDFPTKPIELVVPYSSGSSFDVLARAIADLAPKYLGQPMVVVNKVGAAGSIAAADVINANPDGYKLALLTTIFFSTATKTQKLPFQPTDLIPIANFTEQKIAVVVKGDSPWKTLDDLLNYAKKSRGQLKWCHPGKGTISHINGLILFRKAGVEATDVPYKGGPELLTSILGGHTDASVITVGMLKDQVKAGKIKPLVFLSDQRYSDYRDVPSAPELGFAEAARTKVLIGVYGHKNVHEDVRNLLVQACRKIYDDPQFRKRLEELGDEPRFAAPESVGETIKREEEVNVPVLKELGLYVRK